MSHNEKSPHQSPVHDTRESQPGLDSWHRQTVHIAPRQNRRRRARNQRPPAA